jgi:CheY-like chemotaxis protein
VDAAFAPQLTALEMPRLDGFQLIARIRREATRRGLPIIVLSTLTSQGARDRALAAGANVFLPKSEENDKPSLPLSHYISWSIRWAVSNCTHLGYVGLSFAKLLRPVVLQHFLQFLANAPNCIREISRAL